MYEGTPGKVDLLVGLVTRSDPDPVLDLDDRGCAVVKSVRLWSYGVSGYMDWNP